jgi:hypothetical protein
MRHVIVDLAAANLVAGNAAANFHPCGSAFNARAQLHVSQGGSYRRDVSGRDPAPQHFRRDAAVKRTGVNVQEVETIAQRA